MLTGLSVCGDKIFYGLPDRDQVSRNFCLLEGREQGALQKPTHITNSCHLLTSVGRDVSGVWGTIPEAGGSGAGGGPNQFRANIPWP